MQHVYGHNPKFFKQKTIAVIRKFMNYEIQYVEVCVPLNNLRA